MADGRITLTETPYWHEFTCDDVVGTVRFEEARKHSQTFELIREHFDVVVANGRAWRQISVFGTKSMRSAVRAAASHFMPLPEIRMMGGRETFGEIVEVKIPKRKKR